MVHYKLYPSASEEYQHEYDYLLSDMLKGVNSPYEAKYSKEETEAFFRDPIKNWNGWEWNWYDELECFFVEMLVFEGDKPIVEQKTFFAYNVDCLKKILKYLYQDKSFMYKKIYKYIETIME